MLVSAACFPLCRRMPTWLARGIRIRTIPHMNCLRISTGFWNTEAEIDAAAAALADILGPG